MTVVMISCLATVALAYAVRAARIARRRDRELGEGFVLGLFLGPIGVWIVSRLPKLGRAEQERRNRKCYMLIAGHANTRVRTHR